MAKRTRQEREQLAAGGGAAVLPAPALNQPQPTGVYYDSYGRSYLLPSDPWSQEHYGLRGWRMQPPAQPQPIEETELVGALDDWDWSMAQNPGETTAPAAPVATATYYTKDGTALEGLPADPDSMARYLELGLSLSPAKETK